LRSKIRNVCVAASNVIRRMALSSVSGTITRSSAFPIS
jgi:hypothetical protein